MFSIIIREFIDIFYKYTDLYITPPDRAARGKSLAPERRFSQLPR